MATIKLQPNQPVIMTIMSTAIVEGEYGEQVKFVSAEGTLYMKTQSADKQLARLKLTSDTCVGLQLVFEKVLSEGRQFINITYPDLKGSSSPATAKPAQASVGTASTPSIRATRPLGPLYNDCMKAAVQACKDHLKGTATATEVTAATACLFIAAANSGAPIFAPPEPKPEPAKAKTPPPMDDDDGSFEAEVPF